MGCRADGMTRRWDIAQLKYRAIEKSRNWVVAQMEVPRLKCRADGIYRANNVNPTGVWWTSVVFQERSRTEGWESSWALFQTSTNCMVAVRPWRQFLFRFPSHLAFPSRPSRTRQSQPPPRRRPPTALWRPAQATAATGRRGYTRGGEELIPSYRTGTMHRWGWELLKTSVLLLRL